MSAKERIAAILDREIKGLNQRIELMVKGYMTTRSDGKDDTAQSIERDTKLLENLVAVRSHLESGEA